MVISPKFLLSVPDTQIWIIHGTVLRSKENYNKKEKSKGDCFANSLDNIVGELVKTINVKRLQGYANKILFQITNFGN